MKNILTVGNDRAMLEFMDDLLSRHGHKVVKAEGSLSALNILKRYVPDMVFIDLVMPEIPGDKLCRMLRCMSALTDACIIIISAIAAEEDANFTELGADACIAKGPTNKMAIHILTLMDRLNDKGDLRGFPERVLGLEDVYPRNISKELLFSKKHNDAILNRMSEGIVELTIEGTVVYANPAAILLIGIAEEKLLGSNFTALFSDTANERLRKQMEGVEGAPQTMNETLQMSQNGKQVSLKLLPIVEEGHKSIIITLNDVSEQRRMEARIQRSERMEAIGALAGGVAHDLNNILGGLVGYPELVLLQLPEDSPLRKPILTIQKSGEKATAVVQDLLALARRGVAVTEVVNLNDVIAQYLESPEYENLQSYHPGVHLETHLEKGVLNILGSPTHLSETVMNLVSNAAEAMLMGGNIIVTTKNRYIDRPIRGYDNVKEGDYVVLTIADTGTGISPDDMEKIFEPFYTKKKMGRSGTGLGMAVVWGTVKDHNGYIDIQSTEGKGTTFTLYFPVTRKELSEDEPSLTVDSYRGNGESILVIDDVEEQRNIASGMLEVLGYSVVSVSSGEEAVKYLKTNKADVLLLDMIMDPGMDGLDTYKKIIEIHPGQKAIIASGFSETDRVKEVQGLGAGAYIKKPFLLEKIGLAVKEELER